MACLIERPIDNNNHLFYCEEKQTPGNECCTRGDQFATPAADLLTSFIEYSKWRGTTSTKLGRMLSDAGFVKEKSGTIKWRGLALIQTGNNRHWQDRDDDIKPF